MLKFFLSIAPFALSAGPSLNPALSLDLSKLDYAKVTADRQGNIVIAGFSRDCALPVVKPLSSCGAIWIAKLDPTGRNFVFATYIGTPRAADDFVVPVIGAATDLDGNIVVASYVVKSGLPTVNAIQPSNNGRSNSYVLKLAADGSRLIYATYLGSGATDTLSWFQLDDAGAAYIMVFTVAGFPTTPQSLKAAANGLSVVAKLSPAGQLVYAAEMPYSSSFAYRPFHVDSQGSAVFSTDHEMVRVAPDGSNAQRTPLPLWAVSLYPWIVPTPDGGYWFAGNVTNGFLPVTGDAAQPQSGQVPYARLESGEALAPARPMRAHKTWDFAVDPFERFRVYAATDGGLFKSEDNGWTWDRLTLQDCRSIAIDPFDQNTLYLAGNLEAKFPSGIPFLKSTDRGQTWFPASDGIDPYASITSIATDPNVPGLLYAAGDLSYPGGLFYRSEDGGGNWSAHPFPSIAGNSPSSTLVTVPVRVRADPVQPKRVYLFTKTFCLGFCGNAYSLYRSDDGGRTFDAFDTGGQGIGSNPDLALDASTGDVFVLGSGKLTAFRGGDFSAPQQLAPEGIAAMTLDPQRPGTVDVSLADGTIRISDDGGLNWHSAGKAATPASVMVASDGGVLDLSQDATANDAFVFKFDASGNVTYASYFGGGQTSINAAVAEQNGHLVIAGVTGPGLPVVNAAQSQFAGATDGFIAEFDLAGALLRSTYLGEVGNSQVSSLTPLPDGSTVASGSTNYGFPPLAPSPLGSGSTFAVRLRP